MHFGEKVRAWLDRNKHAKPRVYPGTDSELADLVEEDQPLVSRALNSGNPKLRVARKIAGAMLESLDYLADPSRRWPIEDADEDWDSFVSALDPVRRVRLAARLRVGAVRDLLLGGGQGPHGEPPQGPRP